MQCVMTAVEMGVHVRDVCISFSRGNETSGSTPPTHVRLFCKTNATSKRINVAEICQDSLLHAQGYYYYLRRYIVKDAVGEVGCVAPRWQLVRHS